LVKRSLRRRYFLSKPIDTCRQLLVTFVPIDGLSDRDQKEPNPICRQFDFDGHLVADARQSESAIDSLQQGWELVATVHQLSGNRQPPLCVFVHKVQSSSGLDKAHFQIRFIAVRPLPGAGFSQPAFSRVIRKLLERVNACV
jgi:hypothetical protein